MTPKTRRRARARQRRAGTKDALDRGFRALLASGTQPGSKAWERFLKWFSKRGAA